MIRSKLLLIILSGALLFASCSDSGTDPDDPSDDPIEPTTSVNNPEGDEPLEGEITFSITGEAENGFSEARIYVGDEELETVDNPSMPYQQTIETYNYDNGDYDLRAELDVAEEDTTVEASVTTTFENYMVTLETDDYISSLQNTYSGSDEAAYMFISDSEGNVLRELELTAQSDGTIQLLPPSAIEGEAPSNYMLTIGRKYKGPEGNQLFDLSTDAELPSWSTIYKSGPSSSGLDETNFNELTVEMSGFEQEQGYTEFSFENYGYSPQWPTYSYTHPGEDLTTTVGAPEGSEDLVIIHTPDYRNVDNPVPLYRWEKEPGELENPKSYNVAEDFTQMVVHPVSVPSDLNVNNYGYYMTIASDSFEEGDMYFAGWGSNILGDANGSDAGYGIWVPEITDRSFLTYMNATDENNPNVTHTFESPVMEGFPDEFHVVDAEVQVENRSLDNLELTIDGSADFIRLYTDGGTDSNSSWQVVFPDDTESFVFPKIADSLDQSVTSYNRSDFELTGVTSIDYGKFDNGYSSYLEWQYGTTDFGVFVEWANRRKDLSTDNNKEKQGIPEMRRPADVKTPNEVYLNKDSQKIINQNN